MTVLKVENRCAEEIPLTESLCINKSARWPRCSHGL